MSLSPGTRLGPYEGDAERLARFTREAQTLAALNHPNIAHIHGLEEAGRVRALVLELVEGDDLTARIARGPVPLSGGQKSRVGPGRGTAETRHVAIDDAGGVLGVLADRIVFQRENSIYAVPFDQTRATTTPAVKLEHWPVGSMPRLSENQKIS